jgi:MarR family
MDERMIKAVRSMVSTYREFEQAALKAELSLPQYRMLLFLLNFGPRKASDVAAVYLLKKPTVGELLGTLEGRGLITRAPHNAAKNFEDNLGNGHLGNGALTSGADAEGFLIKLGGYSVQNVNVDHHTATARV